MGVDLKPLRSQMSFGEHVGCGLNDEIEKVYECVQNAICENCWIIPLGLTEFLKKNTKKMKAFFQKKKKNNAYSFNFDN